MKGTGRIGLVLKAILLGLVLIAMVIPVGDVALSQSGTGSSSFTFTSFDVPNSVGESNPYGINDSGQIVGLFLDASFKVHGFLRAAGGTFTTIDVLNAIGTSAIGINGTGQIVGYFVDASQKTHGFLRDVGGTFTTIDVLNAQSTNATGINGTGQIVGYFVDAFNKTHGFLRDVGGTFTSFDAPNAMQTFPFKINGPGQIAGWFNDFSNKKHGFLRDVGGTFTTFDAPNSLLTQAYGINDGGQIVGRFDDASTGHGFLRAAGGTFTTLDVPNASLTVALGINNTGQIVGTFLDTSSKPHDFLANGKPDPRLIVPHWFQAGIPGVNYPGNFWATDTYDSTASTIWAKGCALNTLTILANFWANNVADPTSFSSLDPRQMNGWTGMYAKGTQGKPLTLGNVDWNNWAMYPHANLVKVYRVCSGTNVCNNTFPVLPSGSSPDPIQTLVNILRNGDRGVPVIIPILCGKTIIGKCEMPPLGSNKPVPEVHFVVVTGVVSKNGTFVDDPSTINVNDPGDVTTKTLADVGSTSPYRPYNTDGHITPASVLASLNNIKGWKVYSNVNTSLVPRDPNTPQALGVYTSDQVEFVMTDPLGRRTGFDPVTNTLFEEIPTSAYSTAMYGDEQNPSTPAPLPFKSLDMANQVAGQYRLNVIGTGSGAFTIEVTTSDAAGNWITQTYSGTTAPGASSQFTFQGAVTTFSTFSANVAINNSRNQFAVGGQLTLGAGSPGINPLTQPVTLQVGAFSITIPAGSFQLDSHGNYVFQGTINGVQLAAGIQPQGGNQYAYGFAGQNANNLPTANPVDVRLAIGSDGGSVSVNVNFAP